MATKPPSFPFYGQDFQTGTMAMTPAERGVYIDCLWYQWANGGVPADDVRRLAQVMRCTPAEAKKHWAVVAPKFTRGDDGLYRNARLEQVRANKDAFQEVASRRGSNGAAARWKKHASSIAQALPEPVLGDGLSLSLSSEPTVQRDAREAVTVVTNVVAQPTRYRDPHGFRIDPNAAWQGPIFSIPAKWAERTIRMSNGAATDADVSAFGRALTARLERDRTEAPAKNFLGWLDDEWGAFRAAKVKPNDGLRPASEWIAERDRQAAETAAAIEKAKADGTYRTFAQIRDEIRAERRGTA